MPFLYSESQLTCELQSFKRNRSGKLQAMRGVMLTMLILDALFIVSEWGPVSFMIWFTNWTLAGTIICFSLNIMLHYLPTDGKPWLSILAFHHFLFEIMAIFNVATTFVYWVFLHSVMLNLDEFKGNPNRIKHALFVHSAPGAFFFINWVFSDIVLEARHIWPMIPFGIAYCYTNYYLSTYANRPTYFFMDWINDFEGALTNCILLHLTLSTIYVTMALISKVIKGDFNSQSKTE